MITYVRNIHILTATTKIINRYRYVSIFYNDTENKSKSKSNICDTYAYITWYNKSEGKISNSVP